MMNLSLILVYTVFHLVEFTTTTASLNKYLFSIITTIENKTECQRSGDYQAAEKTYLSALTWFSGYVGVTGQCRKSY